MAGGERLIHLKPAKNEYRTQGLTLAKLDCRSGGQANCKVEKPPRTPRAPNRERNKKQAVYPPCFFFLGALGGSKNRLCNSLEAVTENIDVTNIFG